MRCRESMLLPAVYFEASSYTVVVRTCLRNQDTNASNNMKGSCATAVKSCCETCAIVRSKALVTCQSLSSTVHHSGATDSLASKVSIKPESRTKHQPLLITARDSSDPWQLRSSWHLTARAPVLIISEAASETSNWSRQCPGEL